MPKPPLTLGIFLIVVVLAAGCGGHPDGVAREFYARMAALDVAGMEELVCEEERPAFRDSVGFLEGGSLRELAVQDFETRTERSDGTSATMKVSGRFVDEHGGEVGWSGRVRVVRNGGEWCVSGERDRFHAIRENASQAFFLQYDGGLSSDTWTGYDGSGRVIVEAGVNTPPPDGPPSVNGEAVTTASGLRYIELEPGVGGSPEAGQTVLVHYALWLEASGAMIDSSLGREPFQFVAGEGEVVAGFEEGVATMREGGRRRLIVPPKLGYGDDDDYGDIPPNSTLVFDVELMEVR